MPKYIAKQSLGHFRPGQEVKGLEDKQLQALLASGAIEEEKAPEQPKADGTAAQLASLAAEVAELKANEAILIEGKDKADAEVAELKANEAILIEGKDKADAEVAELKANEAILIEGKDKADAEVAELQKKVEGLEKSLATSEAALKKATAEAKKSTADK